MAMLPICQCRADVDSADIWGQSTVCDPKRIIDTIELPESNPKDLTGVDGYRLMGYYSLQSQQRVIHQLSTNGYEGQVKRFATAVTLLADSLATQYQNKTCAVDEGQPSTTSTTEKPMRGAQRTLRHYIRYILPRQAPDLAALPLSYEPMPPSIRALYYVGTKEIHVGNAIIREIRNQHYASVLSTLRHEKTHRDSSLTRRTITEPLVDEAIALAARLIHNPHCTPDVFRKVAKEQFWWVKDEDGNSSYVDDEDEIYARMTQIVFRTVNSDLASYQRSLHNHIAGIAEKFPPLVAGIIYTYIESVVKTDMAAGYPLLASNMISDAHYIQVHNVMEAYEPTRQICQIPIDANNHALAEPSVGP